MKTAILIPARYASQRLPGKPLLNQTGKYLIQHVYEQACKADCASTVVVATDDARIERAVNSFGGQVLMTSPDHPTGTDRIAEAARNLDAEIIINLQGDEPMVDPASLNLLVELLQANSHAMMSTLAVPFDSVENWQNPNNVKVVTGDNGEALYFSRSPIPCVRDGQPDFDSGQFLHHQGLYAYRRSFLFEFASMPPQPLEQMEKLEQLRALSLGHRIQVGVILEASLGIDTPEDYQQFLQRVHTSLKAA